MRREEISWVRQMVREHYDEVLRRGEELEDEAPVYTDFTIPSILFGDAHFRVLAGSEYRPPISIRDEIMFLKKELKYWSTVNEDVKDEV